MAPTDRDARILRLSKALPDLSDGLLAWFDRIVEKFAEPRKYERHGSDLVDDLFLVNFGDTLRLHHCFSNEPFSKDKFEFAMEWVARACGHKAELATKGNRGHDITIDGVPISLKTEAAKNISTTEIHVSKFMELGKGQWGTDVADLHGLRDQFLAHMASYARIFTLRYLQTSKTQRHYELVELPKSLLERTKDGEFSMMDESKQVPRPGVCVVKDDQGHRVFELYFDGGSERKLQIRHLKKSACILHAEWFFPH